MRAISRLTYWLIAGLSLGAASTGTLAATKPPSASESRTARYLDRVRNEPVRLAVFLRDLPKGADLHNHLSGAIYAENLISWGVQAGLCLHPSTLRLSAAPCGAEAGAIALASALEARPGLYHDLIDAFSMRDFVPSAGVSGHDQFFATFDRFEAATRGHRGDMIAEAANRAAADHVSYLELMDSPGMEAARSASHRIAWTDDFEALYAHFLPLLAPVVETTKAQIAADDAQARKVMRCETPMAQPGCRVVVRHLAQVIRTVPPAEVFAQVQLGYALAAADPQVLGVNLVAPEDDAVTLRDYAKQMAMLHFMGARYPHARLTLHAGELTQGLVPPEDLQSHIRDAVEIAGARRIGHGVDVRYEADGAGLLKEMAARKILVEINLTSNDVILGVKGADHPFSAYRAASVPLALSTDDEGVSRIDLTHEYMRAVQTYGLSYGDLKTLVRNSLEYGFLPGASLWANTSPYRLAPACAHADPAIASPPAACAALLKASEKARLQWRVEGELKGFEAKHWPTS